MHRKTELRYIADRMYLAWEMQVIEANERMRTLIFPMLFLFGCGPGEIGSSAWFNSASQSERVVYYGSICESYGFQPKTDKMSECIALEIDSARQRLEAIKGRAFETNPTTVCNTYGTTTVCN